MAFAGISQPFARLRWIRFGLLMRDRKFSRRFSVPQTTISPPSPAVSRPERSWARAVTRVKERPGFPVTDCGANGRAFQEQRKEGRQEVRGEESRRHVALVGNQLYGGRRQAKRERLGS